MRAIRVSAFVLFLLPAIAIAKKPVVDDADASTPGPKGCPRIQASTIFVPDRSFSRKGGSAKKLSDTHRQAEAQGWDFDEMEVYIEDGDLQGFFVTYTRPHPCNQDSGPEDG